MTAIINYRFLLFSIQGDHAKKVSANNTGFIYIYIGRSLPLKKKQ